MFADGDISTVAYVDLPAAHAPAHLCRELEVAGACTQAVGTDASAGNGIPHEGLNMELGGLDGHRPFTDVVQPFLKPNLKPRILA